MLLTNLGKTVKLTDKTFTILQNFTKICDIPNHCILLMIECYPSEELGFHNIFYVPTGILNKELYFNMYVNLAESTAGYESIICKIENNSLYCKFIAKVNSITNNGIKSVYGIY